MTNVDLITGFLGAGKTTFIRNYLRALLRTGLRVRLIENEFGPVSIDKMLLSDMNIPMDDLSGLCMCCTGKDEFIRMLRDAAESGYDRVLVEPSGIYDVDEFFYVMTSPKVREYCEIGSVIAILDPSVPQTMSDEIRYLMTSQLLPAGRILLSRTQEQSEASLDAARAWLRNLFAEQNSPRDPDTILSVKPWDDFSDYDYRLIAGCSHAYLPHMRHTFSHEGTFQSCLLAAVSADTADLQKRLADLFHDSSCGSVLRVKGLVRLADRSWVEVNATPASCTIRPRQIKRGLLVVIGQGLKEDIIQKRFGSVG